MRSCDPCSTSVQNFLHRACQLLNCDTLNNLLSSLYDPNLTKNLIASCPLWARIQSFLGGVEVNSLITNQKFILLHMVHTKFKCYKGGYSKKQVSSFPVPFLEGSLTYQPLCFLPKSLSAQLSICRHILLLLKHILHTYTLFNYLLFHVTMYLVTAPHQFLGAVYAMF